MEWTVLQFNERPVEDNADAAWTSVICKPHVSVDRVGKLTCGGETSEINTNGTGPRPMAKDLFIHQYIRFKKLSVINANGLT
jgi:hypothetical protein